jgi:hypothetical protein
MTLPSMARQVPRQVSQAEALPVLHDVCQRLVPAFDEVRCAGEGRRPACVHVRQDELALSARSLVRQIIQWVGCTQILMVWFYAFIKSTHGVVVDQRCHPGPCHRGSPSCIGLATATTATGCQVLVEATAARARRRCRGGTPLPNRWPPRLSGNYHNRENRI